MTAGFVQDVANGKTGNSFIKKGFAGTVNAKCAYAEKSERSEGNLKGTSLKL